MNFMKFYFIFNFFILQRKRIYTLNLIVALNFPLLRHDICFQSFFPNFFKKDLHSTNESHNQGNSLANGFFQSPFEANEIFCLHNKFVLLTKHKKLLKCVQQKSYLDLWLNTLYIIWQEVHLLVKLQAKGTNT